MLDSLFNPILLDAAAPVHPRPFDINPVLTPWWLLAGAVVAAAAVVYLYTAQQKIASRKIVNSLTAIRILLILLVIALLLGPVRQWSHVRHSSGTLWVLVDESLSMRQKDPQSSDAERLRWADALGYLPADLRPGRAGLSVNRLTALRDDLEHFRSDADQLLAEDSNSKQREALATHLVDWKTKVTSVADDLSNDAQAKAAAPEIPGTLRHAADTIGKSVVVIQSGQAGDGSPWLWPKWLGSILAISLALYLWIRRRRFASEFLIQAAPSLCMGLVLIAIAFVGWAAYQWPEVDRQASQKTPDQVQVVGDKSNIPWQALHDDLSKSINSLQPVAIKSEKEYLDSHKSDARVKDALDKVRNLNRADLAYAALTANSTRSLKSVAEMMGREDVKVVAFGDHAGLSSPEKKDLDQTLRTVLKDPKGQNTDIASALRFVSDQIGQDSSVVLVSDGRQNVGAEPAAPAEFLASRGARVFTLAMGSHLPARDAAVDHVDAPDWVYAEDQVVISPVIRLDGLKDRDVTVELRRDNQVVDHKTIKVKTDQDKPRLRLTDKPPKEGLYDYDVVIQPLPDEAVLDNNRQSVRVAVKKDKLNILIVEDEPRWEYQFLRNYLVRDHRVKLQVVLVNPARIEEVQSSGSVKASAQREEGKIDAQILPESRAEWSSFDVVILGDVPPEKLPPEQQKNLVGALKDGGVKALLVIAGQRNMPMRYAASPLADAMPVELSGSRWTPQELQEQLRHGYVPAQAPDGLNSILGQFSDDVGLNAELWANMPAWFWHSEQTAARPGATVIWTIEDALAARAKTVSPSAAPQSSADEFERMRQRALLATMNVGLGRVLYLAAPQTWRMRYVQTPGNDSHIEDLHRRFWGQVIRWAAGNDLPAGGKFVRFGANKHSFIGGEPVIVTARVSKEDFTPMTGGSFKIVADRKGGGPPAGETNMIEAPSEGPGIYRGTLTLPAGSYALNVRGGDPERLLASDTSVDPAQKSLQIEVQPDATVEDRDVNSDPQQMAAIAKAGSGIALDGPYFDVLGNHLPVIDHTETQVVQAGLFSNPDDPRTKAAHWAFFALFVILITTEWILRKRGGLV